MSSEKLAHEEATARVAQHFKGRCLVHGDAAAQRIEIRLPNGQTHSLERSLYVRPKRLHERLEMLSRMIDEWEVKTLSAR